MHTPIGVEAMRPRVMDHPFLAGMKISQLELLADCAIAVHFKEGEVIFRQGEPANRFYLLETGAVVLEAAQESGPPVIVDEIGAGDLLGWSWMFPPYAWQFTARAVQETVAIFFYGTILREYCERDPLLGFELLKRMSLVMNRRLQAARNKMLSVNAKLTTLPTVDHSYLGQK